MSAPVVDTGTCVGCGMCESSCPQDVLEIIDGVCTVVNPDDCVECQACVNECPMSALSME